MTGPPSVASSSPAPAPPAHGALAHDTVTRDDLQLRLRRIEGQVRGLQRMVEEGRYCGDTLTQLSSVQEALRSVGRLLLTAHLRHCMLDAARSGDEARVTAMIEEIGEVVGRLGR